MTSPIDPIRPGRPSRRAKAAGDARASDEADHAVEPQNLPVPVGKARTVPRSHHNKTDATFTAHLIGQEGQKRGLRAPGLIETAKTSYNRAEWSGAKDRRTPRGKAAKTDV